jgi:long-chain acyl-CoA synthetase
VVFLGSKQARRLLPACGSAALVIIDKPEFKTSGTIISFEQALSPKESETAFPIIDDRRDLAALMFTSGSTGKPRGVMVSHHNIVANTTSIIQYIGLTKDDRIMAVLPFYYCFGTSLLHTHLRVGGSIVIDDRFMFPDKVLRRMQDTGCTGFAGVPSHFQILLGRSSLREVRLPALRCVQQAGGRLADRFLQELVQALPGSQVFVMYGQTEATARLSYLPPDMLHTKLGSIGRGIPGTTLKVLNHAGQPVCPGEVGEIVAEGENITLGYWQDEAETSHNFRDGQLYTGDLATVDEDGFIFIVDRAKDILKCGGNRVACKEVEDALLECHDLVEAAVVGVPDEVLGEAVKAFVVPRDRTNLSLRQRLNDFCVARLAQHLIPKEIVVLDALPKSETGKVLKQHLKLLADSAETLECLPMSH